MMPISHSFLLTSFWVLHGIWWQKPSIYVSFQYFVGSVELLSCDKKTAIVSILITASTGEIDIGYDISCMS